jgi:hypothetical protein
MSTLKTEQRNRTDNPPPRAPSEPENTGEAPIRIDGMAQVLEMLRVADPAFRESLLKRIALRDPRLAATLRRDLLKEV